MIFADYWANAPDTEAPQEAFNRYASGTYLDSEWWGDLVCWAGVQVIRQPWA